MARRMYRDDGSWVDYAPEGEVVNRSGNWGTAGYDPDGRPVNLDGQDYYRVGMPWGIGEHFEGETYQGRPYSEFTREDPTYGILARGDALKDAGRLNPSHWTDLGPALFLAAMGVGPIATSLGTLGGLGSSLSMPHGAATELAAGLGGGGAGGLAGGAGTEVLGGGGGPELDFLPEGWDPATNRGFYDPGLGTPSPGTTAPGIGMPNVPPTPPGFDTGNPDLDQYDPTGNGSQPPAPVENRTLPGPRPGTTVYKPGILNPGSLIPGAGVAKTIWDQIFGEDDSTDGGSGGLPAGLFGDGMSYLANKDTRDFIERGFNKAAEISDPFGKERGRYQDMLRRSYEDPNYWQNDSVLANLQKANQRETERYLASKGFSNSGNLGIGIGQMMQETSAKYALPQQQFLGQLAGAQFSPDRAGAAIAQGTAAAAPYLSGQWASGARAGSKLLNKAIPTVSGLLKPNLWGEETDLDDFWGNEINP